MLMRDMDEGGIEAAVKGCELQYKGRAARVLQVIPSLISGGAERGTVEIAEAIVKAGGGALVASEGGRMIHELTRVGARHVTLPLASKNPFVMWHNVRRLKKLIKDEDIDLVHARSRAPAWSAFYAAKQCQKPFVTTFHAAYNFHNETKKFYNTVMAKGEKVIAISEFIAGHIKENYGLSDDVIRIVPRGVDLKQFHPKLVSGARIASLSEKWHLPDGEPTIMLPGRLTRIKGQDLLMRALAKIKDLPFYCILVGGDQGKKRAYRAELMALIGELGLEGRVKLVDHCDEMPVAFMLSDIVVCASRVPEGFGRVMAEAQAMGRPVILPDYGAARETMLPAETGWLVPPKDEDALADALREALEMTPEARQILCDKAIDFIQTRLSTDIMCAKTLDVYREIFAER